ncbi:MAG: YoaK family protein [Bacteroidia bacterium]|jgi:uncharacterized membrane protein YoaK (UPF0700 family)
MLRKFSSSRSLADNIKLGSLTAFSAGMVNVASLIVLFAFTSNVTGHFAILAEEIARGNWHQALIVFGWIFMFFFGNFTSNNIIINIKHNTYLSHSIPLILEIVCLVSVGIYGEYHYRETLTETELLAGVLLFAMGLQNGLTASISNFAVKTTHLTGLTTDLGIIASMLTHKEFRKNKDLKDKAKLLIFIAVFYLTGGIISGCIYLQIGFKVFYMGSFFLIVILFYDYSTQNEKNK